MPSGTALRPGASSWSRARVGGCRLQVRDQGPGLSPEAMARLMAAGTGLAPGSRQGVGFGLLFVQRVAARHQGRLEVARAEGGGALFTLDLGTPSGNP